MYVIGTQFVSQLDLSVFLAVFWPEFSRCKIQKVFIKIIFFKNLINHNFNHIRISSLDVTAMLIFICKLCTKSTFWPKMESIILNISGAHGLFFLALQYSYEANAETWLG